MGARGREGGQTSRHGAERRDGLYKICSMMYENAK